MLSNNASTQGGFLSGGYQRGFGDYTPERGGNVSSPWAPAGERYQGTGGSGLPEAFSHWDAASRYAFSPAMGYEQGLQPSLNFFKNQMGKDYTSELFSRSQDAINSQFRQAKSQRSQANARSGAGGGAGVSPMLQYQLNNEAAARAGALGQASRSAVLQAQQMRMQAAQGYQDSLANIYQAYMAPAYLQSAGTTKTPVGGGRGPSPVGAGMNLGAALLNAV